MGRLSEFNSIIAYYNLKNKDKTLERKKQLYNYYKKELKDFEFQNILFDSTYNEIACLIPNKKRDLLIKELENDMEIRLRYDPQDTNLMNTNYVWKNILMIPSYQDVNEKKVVGAIKEKWETIK